MKTYIGTKIIQAEPQLKNMMGINVPGSEGYKVVYPDGYVSWSPKAAFEEAYLEIGNVEGLQPHQVRVLGERAELAERLKKLAAFSKTDNFSKLPRDEQDRLAMQSVAMGRYIEILDSRISHFSSSPEAAQ